MPDYFDFERTPALAKLIGRHSSRLRRPGQRRVLDFNMPEVSDELLQRAFDELAAPEVADRLDAEEFAALAQRAYEGDRHVGLQARLREVLDRRWPEIGRETVREVLASTYHRRAIFDGMPRLFASSELIDALIEADARQLVSFDQQTDLDLLATPTKGQLRRALGEPETRTSSLRAHLLMAAARTAGWTPWLKLFAVLFHAPDLAGDDPGLRLPDAPSSETEQGRTARQVVWEELLADRDIRRLAQLIMDLQGPLAPSPPEFRGVFVERLRKAIGSDPALRQSAVEGLLWLGEFGGREIAIYAAIHLSQSDDIATLDDLASHPQRHVQYGSMLVREALTGAPAGEGAPLLALPATAAVVASVGSTDAGRPAERLGRTWLGNRVIEQMIEATVASLERQVAEEYRTHHGTGEERLGERFFAMLGDRFRMLEAGLLGAAQAMSTERKVTIRVRYRPVDKAEEGRKGVVRPDRFVSPAKFAADFCLVVEATLDGRPLSRRACLVQAKRLYPLDPKKSEAGWEHSFRLKPIQTSSLLKQTASSFYLFQGPFSGRRGLPLLPAQLVDDLAQHQQPSGTVIAAASVRLAGESFAEWFTYQFIALRTGDPLEELLEKALGGPGARPYDLISCGVVEVAVDLGRGDKREG